MVRFIDSRNSVDFPRKPDGIIWLQELVHGAVMEGATVRSF